MEAPSVEAMEAPWLRAEECKQCKRRNVRERCTLRKRISCLIIDERLQWALFKEKAGRNTRRRRSHMGTRNTRRRRSHMGTHILHIERYGSRGCSRTCIEPNKPPFKAWADVKGGKHVLGLQKPYPLCRDSQAGPKVAWTLKHKKHSYLLYEHPPALKPGC